MSHRSLLLLLLVLAGTALAFVLLADAGGEARRAPASSTAVHSGDLPRSAPDAPPAAPPGPDEPEPVPASVSPQRAVVTEVAPLAGEREAELAEGHWVEGLVRWPEGTPADEELVVVARGRRFEHGEPHRAPVDERGRFRVCFAERTQRGKLELEGRYLFLPEPLELEVRTPPAGLVLEPLLGARLHGRVAHAQEPGSFPSDDEALRVSLWSSHGLHSAPPARVTDGTYAFDALPPGTDYNLRLDPTEYAPIHHGGIALLPGESRALDLALERGSVLAGVVRDASGASVTNARLTVQRESRGGPGGWFHRETLSGEDGSYRLAGLPAGTLELQVAARGFLEHAETLELGEREERAEHHVPLARGGRIAGHVRWEDGTPAAGATVQIPSDGPQDLWTSRWTCDEQGRFEISGLGEEPVRLDARAIRVAEVTETSSLTGRERTRKKRRTVRGSLEEARAGDANLVIVLGAGHELAGVVLTSDGERPRRFRVSAERRDATAPGWTPPQTRFSVESRAADGSFTVPGLSTGTWEFRATASGYAESSVVVRRLPEESAPLELRLNRHASIAGRVSDPTGRPVAGANVILQSKERSWGWARDGHVTAADGVFHIEDVGPGALTLTARAAGWAGTEALPLELDPAEQLEGLVLVLRPPCTLTGELFAVGGMPDAARSVRLWPRHGGDLRHALTDDAGRFRFADLAPGEYQLEADSSPEDVALLAAGEDAESAESALRRRAEVTLAEGGTEHVVLRFVERELVHVSGRLRVGGEPFAEGRLEFWPDGDHRRGATATLHDGGTYAAALPGAGEYRWSLHRGFGEFQVMGRVEVPATTSWTFDIEPEVGAVSGRVRDAGGVPLEGMFVTAVGSLGEGEGHANARATTDETGRYRIELLPAATYQVTATAKAFFAPQSPGRAPRYANATREGVVVEPGDEVRGVDFDLGAGGAITGLLSTPSGGAATWITLVVMDLEGRLVNVHGASDATGRFRLTGVPEGRHLIGVQNERWCLERTEVVVRAGETAERDLVLRETGTLLVRLRTRSGELAKGLLAVTGRVDARIHFLPERHWRIEGIPAGEAELSATVNGVNQVRRCTVVAGETREVELRFE